MKDCLGESATFDTSPRTGIENRKRLSERSRSPPRSGPHTFECAIHRAQYPAKVRALTNTSKYDGSSNQGVWLEDYRLVCRMAGIKDDHLIIQFLPIHLVSLRKGKSLA